MKTLLAIWSDADVHHCTLQPKPGWQNGDEHPGIQAVEDHLKHAIQGDQPCDVVRVAFGQLIPDQHHRDAACNADQDQPPHVGRFATQKHDRKRNINTGPMTQF